MEKNEQIQERLSDDAKLLDHYLNQYKYCIGKKKILERRRAEILQEFDNPISSVQIDGMPKGSGGNNLGCAALSFAVDEIECQIKEQIESSGKILTTVMSVIDFLPKNSIERDIIESKYIDRHHWKWICNEYHISRSPAIRKWRKGLNMLLNFKKVKKILKEYKEEKEGNIF